MSKSKSPKSPVKSHSRRKKGDWTTEQTDALKQAVILFERPDIRDKDARAMKMFYDHLTGNKINQDLKDRRRNVLTKIVREYGTETTLDDILPWQGGDVVKAKKGAPPTQTQKDWDAFKRKFKEYASQAQGKMKPMRTDLMTSLNITDDDIKEGCSHCDRELHYF